MHGRRGGSDIICEEETGPQRPIVAHERWAWAATHEAGEQRARGVAWLGKMARGPAAGLAVMARPDMNSVNSDLF
jgi:hypothetical protein